METDLIVWMLFFFGGYSVILGYLLKVAIFDKRKGTGGPPPG
jgi:hypothetical protein